MAEKISDENVVLQKLHEFQSKGNYCDVTVTVGGVQYTCHKHFLAAMSGYFDKLFISEFSENEASNISSEEVVAVFQEVLSYMYTGKIEITLENAYDLLVASDFLVMKELKEHCMKFIEKHHQVENNLKICCFAASAAGNSEFATTAIKNSAIDLSRVIGTDDFLKIEFELLERILIRWSALNAFCPDCHVEMSKHPSKSSYWYCSPCKNSNLVSSVLKEPNVNLLFSKLIDWIKHSVVERLQYFPKLAIYGNLDERYVNIWESLISEVGLFVKQSIHLYTIAENDNHLYTIAENDNMASLLWDNCDNCWLLYDLHKVPFHYLKGIVVGEKQYFLTGESSAGTIVNQFWVGEKQDQLSELQSTPVFGDDYAIACIGNSIYLYMNHPHPIRNYATSSCVDFEAETGSHNIYTYVVDWNKWFTIPPIPKFVFDSYFASAGNMLFVIGGYESHSRKHNSKVKIMQCFDPRTSMWSERPLNVKLNYKGKACSYGNKIFICDVIMKNEQLPSSKTRNIYIYDVFHDQWETITGEQGDAVGVGALVVHDDRLWILPEYFYCKGAVKTYNLKSKLWSEVSCIPSSANFNGVDYKISKLLDALVF